jgi:Ni/Fe-hydrogenase subunit HybB-like protein
MSIVPGWHSTIFAPYFVAGAIFSGTAMVMTLTIPMRKILRLEKYITINHYEKLAKVLLFTALIVSFSYIVEMLLAAYSGNIFEATVFKYRMMGHYKFLFWLMMFCNVLLPLSLFIKKLRRSIKFLFVLSLFVNVGMWLERFNIIVTSLAKEFNPYSWGTYTPSVVELGITIGSFGMFFMFFLIFSKVLPVLSISEIKEQGNE